jgi:hypothetical protein
MTVVSPDHTAPPPPPPPPPGREGGGGMVWVGDDPTREQRLRHTFWCSLPAPLSLGLTYVNPLVVSLGA